MKMLNVIFLIMLLSCNQTEKEGSKVNKQPPTFVNLSKIGFIKTKYIFIDEPNEGLNESRYLFFNKKKYPAEEIVKYNYSESAIECQQGASEGFIVLQRKNKLGDTLPFDSEMYEYKISIDKKQNFIIDNKDTIKKFYSFPKERKLRTATDKQGRFKVYEY